MPKTPRQSKVRDFASIVAGELFFEDVSQCRLEDERAADILDDPNLTAIRVISLTWNWQQNVHFGEGVKLTESINMEMTLRKERRGVLYHWYAYRRVFGKLHKRYVGHSDQITEEKLLKVAQAMPSA